MHVVISMVVIITTMIKVCMDNKLIEGEIEEQKCLTNPKES